MKSENSSPFYFLRKVW